MGGAAAGEALDWLGARLDSGELAELIVSSVPPNHAVERLSDAVPVSDAATERAVIGLLLDWLLIVDGDRRERLLLSLGVLRSEDFHGHAWRVLFEAIREGVQLDRRLGGPAGFFSWMKQRRRSGRSWAEEIGLGAVRVDVTGTGEWEEMPAWLGAIREALAGWRLESRLDYYLRRLRMLGIKRRVIRGAWELVGIAWSGELSEFAAAAERLVITAGRAVDAKPGSD